MKVQGSVDPGMFSIEQQPNKKGYVLVRFYENVIPFKEALIKDDSTPFEGWNYDEYTLELLETATLENDISNQYEMYLQNAKLNEISSRKYDPIQANEQRAQAAQARADIDYISVMAGVDLV